MAVASPRYSMQAQHLLEQVALARTEWICHKIFPAFLCENRLTHTAVIPLCV